MDEFEWEHPETEDVWRVSSEGDVSGAGMVSDDLLDPEPEILVVFEGASEIRTVRWMGEKPIQQLDDEELLDLFERARPH